MKKIIIIVLHFVVILTLLIVLGIFTGNDGGTTNTKFTGELEQGAVIKVLENDTAKKQGYLEELINAFNEAYADKGIQAVDANMSESDDLTTSGPFGYGADVYYQPNDQLMAYVDGGHILPLPTSLVDCYDALSDKAVDGLSRDGVMYAVPVNIQSSLLYYNKQALPADWKENWDDNNNDVPDMLESYPALYEYSMQLKNDGDPNTWGFMRGYEQPYFCLGYLFTYGAYIFGENDTNVDDLGINAGEGWKGIQILKQLATVMDQRAQNDTITVSAYEQVASGGFFCTITTPDVQNNFVDEIELLGKNPEDVLGITTLPMLPASGDLTDTDSELIPQVSMGGVSGYAVSSYTEYPNACLEFINFATSYDMISTRAEMLGITPARGDVAEEVGGTSEIVYQNLEDGLVYLMPSLSELDFVWPSVTTLFIDVAADAFRTTDAKYTSVEAYKEALNKCQEEIKAALGVFG